MKQRTAILRTLAALVACLVSAGVTATAQEGARQTVSGLIKDSTGAVIVGASVVLRSSSGDWSREATTDARGTFRVRDVPPGGYTVYATRDGFVAGVQELMVEASEASVEISLSPAGFAEEVTVAFTAPQAATALRFEAPVQDIPLSVKSYTNSFMKAIETRAVADLYTYMTGVNRVGDTAYDFAIRGMRAGVGNIQYNGLPGVVARMGSPSTSNVERIEVLKGPASVLYGQAQPGGIVNIITKRPQAERSNAVDLRGGTFFGGGAGFADDQTYRLATDLTGPFDKDRKFLYRLVVSYDKVDPYRNFVDDNNELYVVPSFTWNIGAGTILTTEFEYRHDETQYDNGLAAPRNDIGLVAGQTVRYQEPNDYQNETGKAASVFLAKAWTGGTVWNTTFRYVDHNDERKAYESAGIGNNANVNLITVTRRDRHQFNERKYGFLDTSVKRQASTGPVRHTWMLGANGGYELSDFNRAQFSATGLPVNLYQPVYGAPPPAATPTTWQRSEYFNTGFYLQDQIVFASKLKGLAGLRYDRQDTQFEDRRTGQTLPDKDSDAWIPMGGLVFQPTPEWSLYGSYSASYTPALPTALDASGVNSFEPEKGKQLEGGFKADLARGKVNVTGAYFHIERENVLNTVAGVTTAFGKIRSKGVEFDARLKPLQNLQIITGYAYADAVITEDRNPINVGSRALNAPKHNFNVWARYDASGGALKGLGFGLGVVSQSDRVGSTPLAVVPAGFQPLLILPAFTRVDASLYYAAKRYELTFKITNLLDELYYESAFAVTNIFVGAPREGTLSVRFRF